MGILDIINIVLIFQLLLFSFFLFVKKNNHLSNYILGVLLLAEAVGVFPGLFYNHYDYFKTNFPNLVYFCSPFTVLWGPCYYIYIKSLVFSNYKLNEKISFHFVPFVILALLFVFTFMNFIPIGIGTISSYSLAFFRAYSVYIYIFVKIQVLFYIILSISLIKKVQLNLQENYSSISKTNISWLKFIMIGFITCYILTLPIVIYRFMWDNLNPWIELGNTLPYFIYFNVILFKAWYQPEIFEWIEESKKYKSSKLTETEAEIWITQLNQYIDLKKPYLNPDLTLNELADELKINSRILSQIINEYFDQSFYDFINTLRVEESKKILSDSSSKKTILEVLYSCGFNSKSSYNKAFKKVTGITPTEFREKLTK